MQGWRSGHEDAHEMSCDDRVGAFWVLDGHGGDGAALYGAPELVKEFDSELKSGATLPDDDRIATGLKAVDVKLRQYIDENRDKDSGSTVVGAMIAKQKDDSYTLKLINCGDSRGIVVRGMAETEANAKPATLRVPAHLEELKESLKDTMEKASQEEKKKLEDSLARDCVWPLVQETVDHKPSHPTEKKRIEAAGGHVTEDEPPRLDGNLAVSRGLGDFEYKQRSDVDPKDQKVSCIPDIYEVTGLMPGSLCVLCCDGVWDVMTGQDVAELVRTALSKDAKADLGDIAATIVKTSLDKNSRDNVTAMVIELTGLPAEAEKQADEMQNFDKMYQESSLEDEVRKHYVTFLRKREFPPEACPCGKCGKWFKQMHQCPCKQVYYCSRECQKAAWKDHKSVCAAKKPSDGKSPNEKGGAKKK